MKRQKLWIRKCATFWLFTSAVFLQTGSAYAGDTGSRLPSIRIGTAGEKFDSTNQLAIAFEVDSPKFLHARHIEISIGSLSTSDDSEAFVSVGPVWRVPLWRRDVFVDLGFSPTLFSGSIFNGRDLGGNFHFTSSISIGKTFGISDNGSIALRLQHTSNGGLDSANPGIDMLGINFSFGFWE